MPRPTEEEYIAMLQNQLKLFTHITNLQNDMARLKQRVSELEHDNELEQMLGDAQAMSTP